MHHQAQRPEVEAPDAQQAHLAHAQPMAVSEQEQRSVVNARARGGEQTAKLVQVQEADRVGARLRRHG